MTTLPSLLRTAVVVLVGAAFPAAAGELIVSAAASLSNAMHDVAAAYAAAHPQPRVLLNFGGSDVLVAQVAKGAPADVLATADDQSMDRAERLGLLMPSTRQAFARNRLVLIVPSARPTARAADLRDARFARIAVGNPATVPAGRYARAALERAGLWDDLAGKLVYGENVRQVLDYVARGEADAGVVYATDVATAAGRVRIAEELPVVRPILYPVAVMKDTAHPADARAFARFLQSATARGVLARHGFAAPEP